MTKLKNPVLIHVNNLDTLKDLWNRLNINRTKVERESTKNGQEGNFLEYDHVNSECYEIWEGIDKLLIELGEHPDDENNK